MLIAAGDSARQPASRPVRRWGPAKSGLKLSIEQGATVRQGGKFVLSPAVRNKRLRLAAPSSQAGRAAHGIATSAGSEVLDDLITATKDPAVKGAGRMWLVTALAMLGFMVFRGEAPRKLLDAGIDSDNPHVRITVTAALSHTVSTDRQIGLTHQAIRRPPDTVWPVCPSEPCNCNS